MNYPFRITRDDLGGYCANGYVSVPGFMVLTCAKASVIRWDGFADVTGGPDLTRDILACGEDVAKLKDLCLRVVHENTKPADLLEAVAVAQEFGKSIGRRIIQDTIKSVLDL